MDRHRLRSQWATFTDPRYLRLQARIRWSAFLAIPRLVRGVFRTLRDPVAEASRCCYGDSGPIHWHPLTHREICRRRAEYEAFCLEHPGFDP
jgi:hypothetical protein